jgi:glycerol kinase
MASVVLAIDQGTTSTRAALYDAAGQCLGQAAHEITQYYPRTGWVEHDPAEIWGSVADTVTRALAEARLTPPSIAAIGITNQRETVVLWERASGRPVARAIVWQDRRTTDFCRQHHEREAWINERTGLMLDPYFSATKITWLLNQQNQWRQRAEAGELAAGTVDSYLVALLTGRQVHATDLTNASRTLLLNLESGRWDRELCEFFGVPMSILPEVRPSSADYGLTRGLRFLPDGIPIRGVAGDQQAALFGQRGFRSGDAKCTYGTGAFFLLHTGSRIVRSQHRLVSTFAATLDGEPQYALEGSVFIAGAAVQWLRDKLHVLESANAMERMVERSDMDQPVIFVPALVGMGAPYWVPEARGVIFGLSRGTTPAELARAVLEGVACQVADLVESAAADVNTAVPLLRADGGMARNGWFLQHQADMLGIPVACAANPESTSQGAAYLAGLGVGFWKDQQSLLDLPSAIRSFEPRMPFDERARLRRRWKRAVQTVIDFYRHVEA